MKNFMKLFLVSVLTFVCSYPLAIASNQRRQPPVVIYNPKPVDIRPKTERVRPYIKKDLTMVDGYNRRKPKK